MIYEMEYITNPNSEEVNNYTKAFGITALVSILCFDDISVVKFTMLSWVRLLCNKHLGTS